MKNAFAVTMALMLLGLSIVAQAETIADAKQQGDNQSVTLSGKVVTYAATDFFYVEEDNRSMGIMVSMPAHGLTVGMRADVTGTMATNTNRERYILATSAVQTASASNTGVIAPVGMANSAVGGGDWEILGAGGQKGATGSSGLNNIGSLVKIWGAYQQVNATTFTVEDGAGLFVKCTVPSGTFLYSGWQYVAVTGISSMYKLNSAICPPNLLVSNVQVLLPVEAVSIPGTPVGNTNPLVNFGETYSTSGSTCSQGYPLEYSFNWGDGTSSPWSTSTSASHSWSAPGKYTVMVTGQVGPGVSASSSGLQLQVNVTGYTGQMIYIPAGSFLMGNSGIGDDATDGGSIEFPQHSVTLSAYYIGEYDVTRGDYAQFMNAGGYSNSAYWSNAGWSWKLSNNATQPKYWAASQNWLGTTFTQTDSDPVVGATYYEAEAFCNWAGGHLPTEAQWERAARWTGTHPNVYPWGDLWDPENCNCGQNGYQTSPVGSYPSGASPCGCMDMAGNVYEWCQDWYKSYPGSTSPFDDTGSEHALRGGSWSGGDYGSGGLYRCARRFSITPNDCGSNTGFRLAR